MEGRRASSRPVARRWLLATLSVLVLTLAVLVSPLLPAPVATAPGPAGLASPAAASVVVQAVRHRVSQPRGADRSEHLVHRDGPAWPPAGVDSRAGSHGRLRQGAPRRVLPLLALVAVLVLGLTRPGRSAPGCTRPGVLVCSGVASPHPTRAPPLPAA